VISLFTDVFDSFIFVTDF